MKNGCIRISPTEVPASHVCSQFHISLSKREPVTHSLQTHLWFGHGPCKGAEWLYWIICSSVILFQGQSRGTTASNNSFVSQTLTGLVGPQVTGCLLGMGYSLLKTVCVLSCNNLSDDVSWGTTFSQPSTSFILQISGWCNLGWNSKVLPSFYLVVLVRVSFAVLRHCDQKQLGRKGFLPSYAFR